jgi:Fe2+ or Zn2+ uptake regulation protein
MADIRAALPGVSDATIRNALDVLRAEGVVNVDGTGRNATWNRERNHR